MKNNEISIHLQKGRSSTTGSLYQYDYGQRLIIYGAVLPETYEVHFSNEQQGSSKTVLGDSTGVAIPDEYLTSGDNIHVWIYLHDGDADGETEYHGIINVIKRARPTDQEPTPVQQDIITQAIAALNTAVEKTEESEKAAEDAANSVKNAGATAETLAPGSSATVVVRDVDGVKTFEFGIPEGQKGEKGERGQQGIQGEKGEKGDTGEQGQKGDKGDKGDPGEQGIQGEVGPKGDKGDPGEVTQAEFDALADDVSDLKSALNETIESGFHIGKSETDTEITPTYTNGWLKPNGDVITSSAYHYTNKIHVQAGDVVKRLYGGDIEAVCAYNGNTPIESKGTNSAITSYTVPDGIDYVVLTIYSGYSGKILVITPLHEMKIVTDDTIIDSVFKKTAKTVAGTSQGWRLNEADGLCATDQNYKIVKYAVTAGDIIVIQSDDRFQFQNSSSVPSSLPSNKIGMVYGEGLFCVKVPSGATYLIMSTPTEGIAAAYGAESVASSLAEEGSAWS